MQDLPRMERLELTVALACFMLGAFVLVGSGSIESGSGYDPIGPRFFPYLVGAGLMVSGAGLMRAAPRKRDSANRMRLRPMLTLVVALVASVSLLERAGFIATSTLLFWLVARAFESDRPKRDAVVGLALAVVVYVVFTRGLGLELPVGLLTGFLSGLV